MEFILGIIILLVVLGQFFIWTPKEILMRSGLPERDGKELSFDDPRIPASIKARALHDYRPGCQLFFADTMQGGEWWLMDGDGLIEAYWLLR